MRNDNKRQWQCISDLGEQNRPITLLQTRQHRLETDVEGLSKGAGKYPFEQSSALKENWIKLHRVSSPC